VSKDIISKVSCFGCNIYADSLLLQGGVLVGLVALAVTLVDVEAALDELCVEWFS
jgi:hypothetical protein